jgi:hypothetical protein
MRRINKDEFGLYMKGVNNPVIKEALSLNVEEGVEIGFEEWDGIQNPISSVRHIAKYLYPGREFKCRQDKEGKNWKILRTK